MAGAARTTTSTAACGRRTCETLLIGGELDFATPPQVATKELLPHLPNGHQVVLPGFGHIDDFWSVPAEGGHAGWSTRSSTRGKVDDSLYTPQKVDFTPEVTQTAIAQDPRGRRWSASPPWRCSRCCWMARRVRRRGRFGRKASAVLALVYPVVLGLGGWFLGVLIVLTTMPGVPLDDDVLAALSVGVPVGLGVYLAWVDRDRPSAARATGFAAALAGALVGGWLGFNAAEGLVALATTIVGAIAGANLILLVLDIAWDRQAADRSTDRATETLEPSRLAM